MCTNLPPRLRCIGLSPTPAFLDTTAPHVTLDGSRRCQPWFSANSSPEPCSLPPWPSPSLKHQARDEKSVRMHRATDSARC